MERITLRRTLNVGNFETISAEYTAEGGTLDEARLVASKTLLYLLYAEAYRIFEVRQGNTFNQPDVQITNELNYLKTELENLNLKK